MANFIWHELVTRDPDAAAKFYGAVVGWTTQAYDGGGDYRLFVADRGTAGLMRLPEGATAGWVGYIGVGDVDAEAEAIRAAGGAVHFGPEDIPTVGRIAAVADPQGATYNLIKPISQEVPPPVPPYTPGHAGWCELVTSDWAAAWEFYAARYGWTKDFAMGMGPMGTYQTFAIDGVQSGGMMNSPVPKSPAWLYYFNVADIDAAKAAVEAGGGQVSLGPVEVPGGGYIVQGVDPQGLVFAVTGPRVEQAA
ncbi:VOC family protein [Glacieibacterium sp.]|uniref:VOC family protein n=1 Tax=Glacieibacterium sp. TaxID=2860237 RepID=UPI003B003422